MLAIGLLLDLMRSNSTGLNVVEICRYGMVTDDTPITGGDMKPTEHMARENVYNSYGVKIPNEADERATNIYKKICDLVG